MFFKNIYCLLLVLLVCANPAVAGPNANATVSLDLIVDGGAGNQMDDGVTSGTVSGQGTKIAVEVFTKGVTTPLQAVVIKFDFDASVLKVEKVENSAFSPILDGKGATFLTVSPATLPQSGFLARAEFSTVTDVTGQAFTLGIATISLQENSTSKDDVTTTNKISFNANNTDPSADFDGNGVVGIPDFLLFVDHFGTSRGDAGYDAKYDLDGNDTVGVSDFLIFVDSFGSEVPPSGGGDPPTGTDFDLDSDNSAPEGITYANNRFYVVDWSDERVYVYTMSGQRDTGADFDLDNDSGFSEGITYANNRFYVVDWSDERVFVYTMSGQRDTGADFDLDSDNSYPEGITYANNRFYVVDDRNGKVFVYTMSGQRDTGADFDLDSDNSYPEGITYANNRFYVVDRTDDKVYVYMMSGQRDTGADFDLDSDNSYPSGITYANNRFYVVDWSDDKVYVYTMSGQSGSTGGGSGGGGGGGSSSPDLIVESPSVSDNTLTTGQSFTLRTTVRNQGTGSAASTTLRYYRSSNSTISTSDTAIGTDSVSGLSASGTSAESISLNAPSSAGTYYYGACVESVSGESDTNNNCSTGVRVTVSSSGSGGGGGGSGGGGATVTIPDANLRAVITDSLGKSRNASITRAEMATLTRIDAPRKGIRNLTGLEHATNLQSLTLSNNSISDISALSNLTNLTWLGLESNSISDISALSNLTNLTGLDLADNSISDISALSNLTNLTRLYLDDNSISDISALSNLTNLTRLDLDDNSISDISALSNLTNLTWLGLSVNSISDISALSNLTNLERLILWNNSISDISALSNLTNLTWLNLGWPSPGGNGGNSISDISPLVANTGLGSGDTVTLTSNPLSSTSINTHIPALQRRGVTVEFDSSSGSGGGGGTSPPSGDAVTGSITDCSVRAFGFVFISGTVRANRSVSDLLLTGYIGNSSVGFTLIGSMSAGQSKDFTITGTLGSEPSGRCRVQMTWRERGNKSQSVVDEQ